MTARLWPTIIAAFSLAMAVALPGAQAAEPTAEAIHAAIKAANPEYAGDATFKYADGKLAVLSLMRCKKLVDTTPLAELDLRSVRSIVCYATTDLEDLAGFRAATSLRQLNVERCKKVADLSPIKGLPIEWIRMYDLPLVTDLSPLTGMPLWHLDIGRCVQITDLSPINGMDLKDLRLDQCPGITDLSPLTAMQNLEFLTVFECPGITDYSALKGKRLKTLLFSPESLSAAELQLVRDMDSLELLGSNWGDWAKKMTPAQFWARYDAAKATDHPTNDATELDAK